MAQCSINLKGAYLKGLVLTNFNDYLDSPEGQLIEKANDLLSYFLVKNKDRPTHRNWKQSFKDDLLKMIIKCHENNISPMPECLIELSRQLLGKKHGKIFPIQKYYVLSRLSQHYAPDVLNEKNNGIVSFAARALAEAGGLRPLLSSTSSGRNDLRKTVRQWLSEDGFLSTWHLKRNNYIRINSKHNLHELLEASLNGIDTT